MNLTMQELPSVAANSNKFESRVAQDTIKAHVASGWHYLKSATENNFWGRQSSGVRRSSCQPGWISVQVSAWMILTLFLFCVCVCAWMYVCRLVQSKRYTCPPIMPLACTKLMDLCSMNTRHLLCMPSVCWVDYACLVVPWRSVRLPRVSRLLPRPVPTLLRKSQPHPRCVCPQLLMMRP